jgi:N-hydroxyarylamine O-acetyltransferase
LCFTYIENLDPLTGKRVKLDPESLQRKLIDEHRGGYCFEHNGLMQLVLRQLGFAITPLGARVVWNATSAALPPRTHCLTLVELDDTRYIVDVGFGSLTPTAPLRLEANLEQRTPHETMRLLDDAGTYVLEAQTEGTWRAMYRFDLQPQLPSDYAMGNWYVSTLPESHFVTRLGVARVLPNARLTLRADELATHDPRTGTTRSRVESVAQLRVVLTERFGIHLPEDPALETALVRTVSAA